MCDTTSISGCTINMVLDNVGNALVDVVDIIDGELVDELIDVGASIEKSELELELSNVANALSHTFVAITDGELLDEVSPTLAHLCAAAVGVAFV